MKIIDSGDGLFKPTSNTVEEVDKYKAVAKAEINEQRDKKKVEIIEYNTFFYDADKDSQLLLGNAITLYSIAGATPDGFMWRDYHNIDHPFTLQDLIGLGMAIANRTDEIMKKSWQIKAQIDNCTTIEEIEQINW